MSQRYILTEEKHYDEEFGNYTAYGIKCGKECISEISLNRKFVENIIDKLNSYEADPTHFHDIVEDLVC